MNDRLRGVLPFAVGLCLFALLAIFNQTRGFDLWRNYALSGVVLGGGITWLMVHFDARVPHYIQWTIIGATLTHYGGGSLGSPNPYHMGLLGMHGVNGAYHHFDWWDHLTHGVGIGASAMGLAYLFESYQTKRGLQWSGSGLWIVTMLASLCIGVAVELYEFLGKQAFQTIDQGGYENTMRDLHFNLIGAGIGATLAIVVNRQRFQQRILARWPPETVVPRSAAWWRRTTPVMVGIITFTFIPAMTAIALATRFFAEPLPLDDRAMYDPALWTMTASVGAAMLVGPIAGWTHAWWRKVAS